MVRRHGWWLVGTMVVAGCAAPDKPDSDATASYAYVDADGDGFGAGALVEMENVSPGEGYSTLSTDCNDSDAEVNPAASEQCNSQDDNCNDEIDERVTTTYYLDADGDNYGNVYGANPGNVMDACVAPDGYVELGGDCDDSNWKVHPGAQEACNYVDDNCNGTADEGEQWVVYRDEDDDGYGVSSTYDIVISCYYPYGYSTQEGDCNDQDPEIYLGALEICDGKDNDCGNSADEDTLTWYLDADGDGYASDEAEAVKAACPGPEGYVLDRGDCDDLDVAVYPGTAECSL